MPPSIKNIKRIQCKNTTACLQHKPQTGCHKTAETT